MPADWPVILEIMVLVTVLFFVPCLILGTISPVVAKLAVRDLATTGATVGKIYAARYSSVEGATPSRATWRRSIRTVPST